MLIAAVRIVSGRIVCGKASGQHSTERDGALLANNEISEHHLLFYSFYHHIVVVLEGTCKLLWSSLNSHNERKYGCHLSQNKKGRHKQETVTLKNHGKAGCVQNGKGNHQKRCQRHHPLPHACVGRNKKTRAHGARRLSVPRISLKIFRQTISTNGTRFFRNNQEPGPVMESGGQNRGA